MHDHRLDGGPAYQVFKFVLSTRLALTSTRHQAVEPVDFFSYLVSDDHWLDDGNLSVDA